MIKPSEKTRHHSRDQRGQFKSLHNSQFLKVSLDNNLLQGVPNSVEKMRTEYTFRWPWGMKIWVCHMRKWFIRCKHPFTEKI